MLIYQRVMAEGYMGIMMGLSGEPISTNGDVMGTSKFFMALLMRCAGIYLKMAVSKESW